MNKLIERFSSLVKGSISGFDRIVFKGFLLPLMNAGGATWFCRTNGILNKDYKSWMMERTGQLVDATEEYANKNCGRGITPISSWKTRKEGLARERQKSEGIEKGLIGVWSCVEAATSYRARFCGKSGHPQLRRYQTRCKHLYFYYDHEDYGFMNIRLQTWFPYPVQVCMNGREWLRRSLEKQNAGFVAVGNKFLDIDDYQMAQGFLDRQLDARFAPLLDNFIPNVFPTMPEIFKDRFSYYWTMWQSEWASDLIFSSPEDLGGIMNSLLRHAHVNGTSARVLRYMDRPLTLAGRPYASSRDEVSTRVNQFNDGFRIRHWVDRNSVKIYNEQNVLRVETTINDPKKFKVFRHKTGQSPDEPKTRLPIRKGVADIPLRAQVSRDVNNRIMEDVALFQNESPARDVVNLFVQPVTKSSRRFRPLDVTGKDWLILRSIGDPALKISGMTNKALQQKMGGTPYAAKRNPKQLSAKISRHLKLLRVHGVIKKMPRQNRYLLTEKGALLIMLLNGFMAASTESLLKLAA